MWNKHDFGDSKYMRQVRQACMGRPFFHYIIITKYSACFYSQKDTFLCRGHEENVWYMDDLQVCRHSVTAVGFIRYPRQIEQVMYRLKSRTRCFRWVAISTQRSQRSGDRKLESQLCLCTSTGLPLWFCHRLGFEAAVTPIWRHYCWESDPSLKSTNKG